MAEELSLFPNNTDRVERLPSERIPLAEKLRPMAWSDFRGLEHLDRNLIGRLSSGQGVPPSLVLWGPPGSGKTTLARLIGKSYDCNFVALSAVLSGVKEVRDLVDQAKRSKKLTILFVDEIHRFNKAQQDAFLPHIETGTICFIGATTENPSFYLTQALLSRVTVVPLPGLGLPELRAVLCSAEQSTEVPLSEAAREILIQFCGGDARRLLNLFEGVVATLTKSGPRGQALSAETLKKFLVDSNVLYYDRSGDQHYNMASAFIKSMRGSDPDAALYWAFRMIASGEDPRFIIRRMVIFASEDISNADPHALILAVATFEAFEKIGLPEGRIPIAQCITYLATAPKSNRSYTALNLVLEKIDQDPKADVPLHIRNAPTKLMKDLGYGQNYQYPHESESGYIPGISYLPDSLKGVKFYEPKGIGLEAEIIERMKLHQNRSDKT